jgi:hypothetical protein
MIGSGLNLDVEGVMKSLIRALDLLLAASIVFAVFSAVATPAYAYADPGTGLLMIQLFTSMFAGALFMVRRRLHRIYEILTGTSARSKKSTLIRGLR